MSDKFRRVIPLRITIAEAEQPSAAKLTAIGEQSRLGMTLVERALGDLWNQGADSLLLNTPLQIPNLARIIGQNYELNPIIVPPKGEFLYTEYIGGKFENLTEGHLLFKPRDVPSLPETGSAGIFATGVQKQTLESDVKVAGDWWIDGETGRFRVGTPLTNSDILAYDVADSDWHQTNEVLPGVIPDPRQIDFQYVRVEEFVAGRFYIHLPPRRPLALSTREAPARYPPTGGAEETANEGNGTSPHVYWNGSVTAAAVEFYRYQLPKEIQDYWASYSSGDQLPIGFLWLYDTVTDAIVEDVLFLYPATGDPWTLEVTSDTFDFSSLANVGEAEANYDSGLVLITCGAPIARSIAALSSALLLHNHDGSFVQDKVVSHENLLDRDPPTIDYTEENHDTQYPSYLPPWGSSTWAKDNHMSLLSRVGAHASWPRDQFNNAMLGDLLVANADVTTSGFINNLLPDNSFKVVFGDTDGSYIRGIVDGQVQINSIDNEVLRLTTSLIAKDWDFKIDSTGGNAGALVLRSTVSGVDNTCFMGMSADGTTWLGNIDTFLTDQEAAVVIRENAKPMITFWEGSSDTYRASIYLSTGSQTFFSNSNNFASTGSSGNGYMNICGQSGVRFRYGNTDTGVGINEGTIGAVLKASSGAFFLGDGTKSFSNTSFGIDADGKATGWRAINAQNASLAAGETIQLSFGQEDANGNCAELIFEYQGDDHADNALRIGFHSNTNLIKLYNDGDTYFNGTIQAITIGAPGISFIRYGGAAGDPITTMQSYAWNSVGNAMYFSPGSELCICGGEPNVVDDGMATGTTEDLILATDTAMRFYTGTQGGADAADLALTIDASQDATFMGDLEIANTGDYTFTNAKSRTVYLNTAAGIAGGGAVVQYAEVELSGSGHKFAIDLPLPASATNIQITYNLRGTGVVSMFVNEVAWNDHLGTSVWSDLAVNSPVEATITDTDLDAPEDDLIYHVRILWQSGTVYVRGFKITYDTEETFINRY